MSKSLNSSSFSRQLLVLLTGGFVLDHLDRHILSITLNQIGLEFQLNDLQLGTLSGVAFAVVYVVLGFPLARMTVPGRRKTIIVGTLTIWSMMTALMAVAGSYAQLLMARIGVGVGEAGYTPAAHSMIIDSFPEKKRASALAAFSAGSNIGVFFAFILGGIVAAKFGWRAAFLVAGVPGILLALVMVFRLYEPKTAAEPQETTSAPPPTYRGIARRLLRDRVTRHVLIGSLLAAMVSYGALAWVPMFLARSHNLGITQIGIFLALVIGIGGGLTTWFAGVLSDRLAAKGASRRMTFVAATILVAKPLAITAYLTDSAALTLTMFVLPAMAGGIYLGPAFAHIYHQVPPDEKPMTTAIMMFTLNLIGLGLGPFLVGLMSETLSTQAFESIAPRDTLKYALAALQFFGLWGAYHFWRAAALMRQTQKIAQSRQSVETQT
ncbi:L-galactonate transporter [Thalassovita gelatinovora]|uniref:L-galactonate transporter n=1 Tax=Thalassovita gelatinovora TaxID=53501 RepID=A0A0P1F9B9_THAGE|nr:MFS transporter [Thalassovita gelatinovora]QIZ81188.1 MFS transporter [Thalassovita gelatinovora]CUH64747.1 L-galactonate transporter [Thalassovita gelatinovora]SEP92684.1 Predicted arabinose efflux permease, MFS family [Thalassovita gelatinovora]